MNSVYRVHKLVRTRAYNAGEVGTFYLLGNMAADDDTDHYEEFSEPTTRVFEFNAGVLQHAYMSVSYEAAVLLRVGDQERRLFLSELLGPGGRSIDARIGHTREERDGDNVVEDWLAEINTQIEEQLR